MEIPSYLYDEIVSEGYVSLKNYKRCLDNNFAYREGYVKKSSKKKFNEIISGYSDIIK